MIQVELGDDDRGEHGEGLAINVVDDGGKKERQDNPPAEASDWFHGTASASATYHSPGVWARRNLV